MIAALTAEEANLLHARHLARRHGWWSRVIYTMQGLLQLYEHTGRRAEWKRLVDEIVPDFVDPATDGPLPGREKDDWGFVTTYRVRLAIESRHWKEAKHLQRMLVGYIRQQAAAPLAVPPESLDDVQRNTIRKLAASLHELAEIERGLLRKECVPAYEESLALLERIGDKPAGAACTLNLGHAYKDITSIRDLAKAESWYRRSLDLTEERDRLGRAKCLHQLGGVAYERSEEARKAEQPREEMLKHLNAALHFCHQALDMTPLDAVGSLAAMHNALGIFYSSAADFERALSHWREAIRYFEAAGDLLHAGQVRFNVAMLLTGAGRVADALDYARAALRGFSTYGSGASEYLQRTQTLVNKIQESLGERKNKDE